jgi:hypothetical protein
MKYAVLDKDALLLPILKETFHYHTPQSFLIFFSLLADQVYICKVDVHML